MTPAIYRQRHAQQQNPGGRSIAFAAVPRRWLRITGLTPVWLCGVGSRPWRYVHWQASEPSRARSDRRARSHAGHRPVGSRAETPGSSEAVSATAASRVLVVGTSNGGLRKHLERHLKRHHSVAGDVAWRAALEPAPTPRVCTTASIASLMSGAAGRTATVPTFGGGCRSVHAHDGRDDGGLGVRLRDRYPEAPDASAVDAQSEAGVQAGRERELA